MAPAKKKSKVTSLTKRAFEKICSALEKSILEEEESANFVCAGVIPVTKTGTTNRQAGSSSSPIRIFWERQNQSNLAILPIDTPYLGPCSSDVVLGQLVADCEAASFGRRGEEVMDPAYRKVGKLDPHRFATIFHPAEFAIFDEIEKFLAPQLKIWDNDPLARRRIRAELYKLNSHWPLPSHVDTPRSKNQIGSLVVCLPSTEGGDLAVRHNGRERLLLWAEKSTNSVQWAAFYSDCEHEIKSISSGYRLTLTYNLYIYEPLEKLQVISPTELESLIFYDDLKNLLKTP
ncbi:hypothetical protein N7532_000095 [Penicillium argentinense]|uniref:Fe2OG dioxygenase domain-containing protein n=1 Tax=Penicillium argentinense TaxID=1131581 RepID=A0A9W9KMX8_9EURO|nr:uncharacterized protein N7532_000095 [Penicillium argentinense]KAJ5112050.1 hypothetical protein N7532_000095 [Penicillium argentinense]